MTKQSWKWRHERLADLDAGHLLGATWGQIAQAAELGNIEEAQRQLAAWEEVLQAQLGDLGDLVRRLAALRRSLRYRGAQLRLQQETQRLKKGLSRLAEGVETGDERIIARWSWVAHAYGHAILKFLDRLEAEEAAAKAERQLAPQRAQDLAFAPLVAALVDFYQNHQTSVVSQEPQRRLHALLQEALVRKIGEEFADAHWRRQQELDQLVEVLEQSDEEATESVRAQSTLTERITLAKRLLQTREAEHCRREAESAWSDLMDRLHVLQFATER